MISHPDAEVQSIITLLEEQRDGACVRAAQAAKNAAEVGAALAAAQKEVETLKAALEAAGKFQGNVIPIEGSAA